MGGKIERPRVFSLHLQSQPPGAGLLIGTRFFHRQSVWDAVFKSGASAGFLRGLHAPSFFAAQVGTVVIILRFVANLTNFCDKNASSCRKAARAVAHHEGMDYVCNAFQLNRRPSSPTFIAVGFFYASRQDIEFRPPCRVLMHRLPVQGGMQRESGTLLFFPLPETDIVFNSLIAFQ